MCDGRAAEAYTDLVKTLEIAIGQIGVTLADVIGGFIHPMLLIVLFSPQDATAIDMAKQLVACSLQEFLFAQIGLRLSVLCAHVRCAF